MEVINDRVHNKYPKFLDLDFLGLFFMFKVLN